MAHEKVPFSRNKHKTDVVAYLTLFGWLIAYLCGSRAQSRFHLNQALVVMLADLGLNLVFFLATVTGFSGVSTVLRGVCGLLSFCAVVLWIMGLVRAAQGSEKPLPVLGEVQLLPTK